MIFAAIAWRNLWKRKRLTAILTLGIAAGVFSLLLYFAMLDGFLAMMVDTAVDTTLGHIQLHEKSYLAKKDVNALLPDSAALVRSLASLPNIAGVSPRVCAQGLASSARGSGSVAFCGMDPEKERRVTGLQGLLVKGEPLAPGDDEGIMIGRELAKKLRIDTGSKLVIMVRDAAGEMTGRAYRVRGLFTTVSSDFDKTAVFVSRRSACTLLGLPRDGAHEVAVRLTSPGLIDAAVAAVRATVHDPAIAVQPWGEIAPLLRQTIELSKSESAVILFIVFMAVGFGIVNAFFKEIFERIREFGVMAALGSRPTHIFQTLIWEAVLLGALGSALGALVSYGTVNLMLRNRLDYGVFSEGLRHIGLGSVQPLFITPEALVVSVSGVMLAVAVATALPAWRASRFKPAEALKHV